MDKRKSPSAGRGESSWKRFSEQVESSRVRRARTLVRQGAVQSIQVVDGTWTAYVKINGLYHGGYRVQVPAVHEWGTYTEQVSTWLSRRPDWLAALYAMEWDSEFLEFVSRAGLRLFPDAEYFQRCTEATRCTCTDREPVCVHALALVYAVTLVMEQTPLKALEYVGLSGSEVLEQAHHLAVGGNGSTLDYEVHPKETEAGPGLWPEERATLLRHPKSGPQLRHRIVPDLSPDQVSSWKKRYMAFE